jgi:hypothetical protein
MPNLTQEKHTYKSTTSVVGIMVIAFFLTVFVVAIVGMILSIGGR